MISSRKIFQDILGFLKNVLIVELIILILVVLYWWFTGLHTKERLATDLFVGGAIAIIIGFLIRIGSREGTYSLSYHYARLFGATSRDERLEQDKADMERSFSDLFVLFTAGATSIGLSALINFN
jgi:hypothetical protein